MAIKDEKFRFCMSLFGFITFLFFAFPVQSESSKNSWSSCTDGYGLNYTLPMLELCKVKPDRNGNMVQTIPKVIPFPSVVAGCNRRKSQGDIPAGLRICSIPDCGKNLCRKGWCEETFTDFNCHCYTGFQGEHCDEVSTETTTQQATTKSTTSPTTTIPVQQTATSKDPTPSEPTELQTTEATSKLTTSPTTTNLEPETTTSQDTTTRACASPLEVLNGWSIFCGSSYYFSTSEMDHASANSSCSEHDSHLVYIETEEEQDFIENQIEALDSNLDYWIGLRGHSREDARWLDGSSLTYDKTLYSSFNDGGECFRIKYWSKYWHDGKCWREYGYICEKEIGDNV